MAGADGKYQYMVLVILLKLFSAASPGYFTTTFTNGIKIEATSTRRSGLIRFTYPSSSDSTNYVVIDLTNDLQRSFEGGALSLDSSSGRATLQGAFLQVRIIIAWRSFYVCTELSFLELRD